MYGYPDYCNQVGYRPMGFGDINWCKPCCPPYPKPCPPPCPTVLMNHSDFYALMPTDNTLQVAAGGNVEFPNDGPSYGNIVRASASQILLPNAGIYEVNFQVSVDEAAQLVVSVNGIELPYTTVGRGSVNSQIVGVCLVETATSNSILAITNPLANAAAITITPNSGGQQAVSAHVTVKQLS